jgi:phosphoglycerol transferase MdoB-like AlkP superfamily enzyme
MLAATSIAAATTPSTCVTGSGAPASNATPPLPAAAPKKNLLFFLMESWSAEPLLYQSPTFDVLGRLAPTMDKACHFRNFDSAQPGTHPALEAILFSSPITPLTLGDIGRKPIPWSIAKIARDAGYHTLFVTSARSGWRDLNRVLAVQGFDEVIDANNLKVDYPDAFLGIWGVWDSYVFKYLSKRMAAHAADAKPLFVFVLTSTNHPPYDLPADYQRVPRDMALWKGETSSETLLPNLDTFHYASDLLGGFVQEVQKGPLHANTLIAASGDHNVRSFGVYATPERRYLARQVPFVIWGEGLHCSNQLDQPASHRDMFPPVSAGRHHRPTSERAQPCCRSPNPMPMRRAPCSSPATPAMPRACGSWASPNPFPVPVRTGERRERAPVNSMRRMTNRSARGLDCWTGRCAFP